MGCIEGKVANSCHSRIYIQLLITPKVISNAHVVHVKHDVRKIYDNLGHNLKEILDFC